MNLSITIPHQGSCEIRWVASVLFETFLGLDVVFHEKDVKAITVESNNKHLIVPTIFFPEATNWLSDETIPKSPPPKWDTRQTGLPFHLQHPGDVPVLFGSAGASISSDDITLGCDIFGSVFFLLSRYEEAVTTEHDKHDRINLKKTYQGKHNLVSRPLVDEYTEILRGCLLHLWPDLPTLPRTFQIEVSCDLDHIFSPGAETISGTVRKIGGEILNRKNIPGAIIHAQNYFSTLQGDYQHDPYYQALFKMMDINEKAGNCIKFNIKPTQTHPTYDYPIDLSLPIFRQLLKTIHSRGHEIGFHPGYMSCNDPVLFNAELSLLRQVLAQENIDTSVIGGRQHYLRWLTPETARLWENAGLQYDSTMGFASQAGFRCGTSKQFPMYDLEKRQPMKLVQHPLVMMEVSVISGQYMGLGRSAAALKTMTDLKETCRFYGGNFTLLWHNSFMQTPWDYKAYNLLCGIAPA